MTTKAQVSAVAGSSLTDRLNSAASLDDVLAPDACIPSQLRSLCAIMQASQQPMFVMWGPQHSLLYNLAYAAVLGDRHPAAFGRPMLEVWVEIADVLAPLIRQALAGESIHMDDIRLGIVRNGQLEEAHFSFSYTPIHGEQPGQVLGVFCACTETTQAVAQARAIAAADARRLALFQNAPGFIAVLRGPDHTFEFANHAYHRLAGGRELIGRTVQQAFPEIERQGFIALLDGVYATGQRYVAHGVAVELRALTLQPERTRHLDFVYEPITDDDGRVTGIFVEGFDSTETVHAQHRALEIHSRRQQVLDSMGEGFLILDPEFRVLEINAEGARLDNRAAEQIVGRTHWELWPASVGTPVEANYRRVMAERVPLQFEHRYTDANHDVCLDIRAFPVTGGMAVFYRDVTNLMKTRTALERSNDRFRAAMQAIGVMWTNNPEGRMEGEQPGWAGLTGQSPAEYGGFGWAAAVHPDDAQPTIDAWHQAVAERRLFTFEHRVRRSDGAWRRFAIRAVPVVDKDGALREWVGVHIDITEAALAAEALRTIDRRKDEFLAMLSHELRNPLAPIRTVAEVLTRPHVPPERVQWAGNVVSRQSRIMSLLLDELLDLSRLRSGTITFNPQRVEAAALIETAVETVHHLVDAKRHRLEVRLPDASLPLDVDPLRTTQALVNLLTNAAKYTDPGGELRLEAEAIDGRVRLRVVDNGIGLAPESMATIFELFSQVRSESDRSEGGLGIGLSLTKQLVELQGGRLEAFSEGLGFGSVFAMSFPRA